MLLAGDERNRTQQDNNNAYCQDNPISWVDWTADQSADNLTNAVRKLISLRVRVKALRAPRFPEPGPIDPSEPVADTGLGWFDPKNSPVASQDWDKPDGHSFAVVFPDAPPAVSVLVLLSALLGSRRIHRAKPAVGRVERDCRHHAGGRYTHVAGTARGGRVDRRRAAVDRDRDRLTRRL